MNGPTDPPPRDPKMQRRSAPLLSFRGRLTSRSYVSLQLVSALLLALAIGFAFFSVAGFGWSAPGVLRIELAGWAIGGMVGALLASLLIGAGAVTRRARDGALPAVFIGLFYVINRLLLPVNIGAIGPPGLREMGLQLAFIMLIVQILLLVRGTMPAPEPLRRRR